MPKGKKWSDEETTFLKEQGSKFTTDELAKIIGRSKKAIYGRNTKIRRLTRYDKYTRSKTENDVVNLPQTDLAYIAGIVDGEGSVSFEIRRKKYFVVVPVVHIANTDYSLIQYLEQKIDYGKSTKTRAGNQKWKTSYGIDVLGFRVLPLLKSLLPYLIIKKRRAELVIEYLNLRMRDIVGSPLTQEELKIIDEVRSLNKRGPNTLISA